MTRKQPEQATRSFVVGRCSNSKKSCFSQQEVLSLPPRPTPRENANDDVKTTTRLKWMKSWSTRSLTSDDASLEDALPADSLCAQDDDDDADKNKSPELITDTANIWMLGQKAAAAARHETLTNRHTTLLQVKTQQKGISKEFITTTTAVAVPEQARRQAKVSFGTVIVHHHEVIMGDSPACSMGVPIAMGGRAFTETCASIDEYERDRHDNDGATNNKSRKIPAGQRQRMLRDAGYTKRQVQARIEQVQWLQHISQQNAPSDDASSSSKRSTAYPAPKLLTLLARRHKKNNNNKGKVIA